MRRRGRLARKYAIVLVALVTGALLASGAVEIYSSYNENKAALVALQREKAAGAASRIETFVREIERQLVWTTQPLLVSGGAALEQRRIDAVRLQRQVLAITEVSHLDPAGREQLRLSRVAMDVIGSQLDFSRDPKFTVPRSGRTYFGPVYFRKESEPYMTIAMPQAGGGVTVAEVNLKFIWDVVSQIKVGKAGLAYTVDGGGALIAHPDISLVLQKTSLADLAQVKAALARTAGAEDVTIARDLRGREVLTTHSVIAPLGWVVMVEQPLEEAFAPLRASAARTALFVALGIVLAVVASAFLGRRLARPIRALQESATKIGAGELDHRISLRTNDELESLADEINQMTGRLRESYATLEQRVEDRTRELTESLEQQMATADILGVISSSPTDLQPVMEALVERAARLCEAQNAQIFRVEGGQMRLVARCGPVRSTLEAGQARPLTRGSVSGRTIVDRVTLHIADLLAETDAEYPDIAAAIRREGIRTTIGIPLLREGTPIGSITAFRTEVRPFTDKQIALLQTFADQAVIAIENVRLFKELEEKNRTITEALEQQTATAEILRVISGSPTDVQPVFAAVLASAVRLCGARFGGVFRFDGALIHLVTSHEWPAEQLQIVRRRFPMPPGDQSLVARAIRDRRVVQTPDYAAEATIQPPPEWAVVAGHRPRGTIAIPMLREGSPVGGIVLGRAEAGVFSDQQVALLQTFADQAVIAIENVRLFKELEEKNRTITEALEQQTATAEILKAISGSPTDVQPVFDTIVQSAARLLDAHSANVLRLVGDDLHLAAMTSISESADAESRATFPMPVSAAGVADHVFRTRQPYVVTDVQTDPMVTERLRRTAPLRGFRSMLLVPMLRHEQIIGAIGVTRRAPGTFTEDEISLLQTFADQAVIAIENVRLFRQLQERTAELTRSVGELEALGEVGRTISSTLDLETVLAAVVSRANQLAETDGGAIYEFDTTTRAFRLRATDRFPEEFVAVLRTTPLVFGEGAIGRAASTREPITVAEVADTDAYTSRVRDALVSFGYRSLLAVPLVSENEVVGALVVNRRAAGEFPPRTVELLRTFGVQSALAIQNARLFQEIEIKSRELEVANQHKSEFLASVSHELRTPLNAIIGFSEVMLERMFGEINAKQEEYLHDILSSGRHLLSLINDILDLAKIEAGRMELEATDFHLPQAIDNALILVRERALRREITLEPSIDPRLGEIKGDERKVKQVLVNLLSNAVKFTPEGGRIDVRAVLAHDVVEISVADTGVGIAPEDQQAVFEEFRQVGTDYARKHEGTGLGLALARKFVELHGGTIWVKSQMGEGSTFTFTLPVRPWQAS
jgi:signal transduction histidine kinase/HAMP domain-containing protein